MSKGVKVTTGDVYPSVVAYRYGYRPVERRDYDDGLVMIIEVPISRNGAAIATIWVASEGIYAGYHQRSITGSAHISALVRGFREALKVGGHWPLYDEYGRKHSYNGTLIPRTDKRRGRLNLQWDQY